MILFGIGAYEKLEKCKNVNFGDRVQLVFIMLLGMTMV